MSNFRFNSVNCCNCGNKLVINQNDRVDYICVNCGSSNKSQINNLKVSSNKAMEDYLEELDEAYRKAGIRGPLAGKHWTNMPTEQEQRKIDLMRPNISRAEGEVIGREHANEVIGTWKKGNKLKAISQMFFPTSMIDRKTKKTWKWLKWIVIPILILYVFLLLFGYFIN